MQDARVALDLLALLRAAKHDGWTTVEAELTTLRQAARKVGLSEIPNRLGAPYKSVLRPVPASEAHPRSMSAVHGLGAQPLHTDGAHHHEPPAFVILASTASSATPTMIWTPSQTAAFRDSLRAGVFLVDSGRQRFLATAAYAGGLRFDPTCMTPLDSPARRLAAIFSDALREAIPYHWSDKPQLLILDNRKSLHARAALATGDEERTLQRVAFREEAGV